MRAASGKAGPEGKHLILAAFDKERIRELLIILSVIAPLGVLAAGLLSLYFAAQALQPMQHIAEQAKRIDASRLTDRVTSTNDSDELGQLAAVLNSHISRLERSFLSLQKLTSDSSHELKTPLSIIRSTCEIYLQKSASKNPEVIESILKEVDRVVELTETLLMLARGDSGDVKLNLKMISTRGLALELRNLLFVLAENKGNEIEIQGEDAELVGDSVLIR